MKNNTVIENYTQYILFNLTLHARILLIKSNTNIRYNNVTRQLN